MLQAHYDMICGRPVYDWCFGETGRTPEQHPHSYDAHYLWRDFDKADREAMQAEEIQSVYSDRMMQWDSKKYEAARKASKAGWIENIDRRTAEKFIESYYDGKMICVGFGKCCNVSTGYGIGLFFIKPKSKK